MRHGIMPDDTVRSHEILLATRHCLGDENTRRLSTSTTSYMHCKPEPGPSESS